MTQKYPVIYRITHNYEFNERKQTSLALVTIQESNRGVASFQFSGDIFDRGELVVYSQRELAGWPKKHGFPKESNVEARFQSKTGAVRVAELSYGGDVITDLKVMTSRHYEINPKRPFLFWLSLAESLLEAKKTPDLIKRSLDAICLGDSKQAFNDFLIQKKSMGPLDATYHRAAFMLGYPEEVVRAFYPGSMNRWTLRPKNK